MNDILGDGTGSVQFDPNTKVNYGIEEPSGTLYLNNAIIEGNYTNFYQSSAIYCSNNLTIVNNGTSMVRNNYIDTTNLQNVYGIYASGYLTINGTGTITFISGTGGTSYNCGIRSGLSGAPLYINGPKVESFGGIAESGGKSYGVCIGDILNLYVARLIKGTLETRGYDSAAMCGPTDIAGYQYFVTNGSQKIAIITVSESYEGSDAVSIVQDKTYANYKYITVTNP